MSVTLLPQGLLPAAVSDEASGASPAPGLTYRVGWAEGTNAVGGLSDGLEAVRQAVFKYLQTWRGHYPIYNDQYGIQLDDLIGRERGYAAALLPGRIQDALSVDDRVISVDGFEFEDAGRDSLVCAFTVHTVFGDLAERIGIGV